ncbi:MAG TPA: hypothetical protein PLI18_00655 [Pirellulaceae bacterium]|nr:hypothetical protein [Pirellulaceae bacterium]
MSEVEALLDGGQVPERGPRRNGSLSPAATSRESSGRTEARVESRRGTRREGGGSEWTIEPHDPVADRRTLESLADRCQWFGPLIGLEPGEEPDGVRFEVTGSARWFGGEPALVGKLGDWLRRLGYWPRIAVADTLGSAWGLARFASPEASCRLRLDRTNDTGTNDTGVSGDECAAEAIGADDDAANDDTLDDSAAEERVALREPYRTRRLRTAWSGGATEAPGGREGWVEGAIERHRLERLEDEIERPVGRAVRETLQERNREGNRQGKSRTESETPSLEGASDDPWRSVSERCSPGLAWIAPRGDRREFGALPIAALRVASETVELLRQLGIERVHQLGSLPREGLATRLGTALIERLDQAEGRQEEPWNVFRAIPEFRCELDLEAPSADRTIIDSWLEEVLRRVTETLRRRRCGALRLDVTAWGQAEPCARWRVDLFRPSADLRHLLGLLRLQIDCRAPTAPVARLEVEVPLSGELEIRQQELFDDGSGDRRAAGELIETLSGRLGRERVLEVTLRDGAQPEFAFTPRPVTGSVRSRLARARPRPQRVRFETSREIQGDEATALARLPSGLAALRRPLRCWNPPLPIEAVGRANERSGGAESGGRGGGSAPHDSLPAALRFPHGLRAIRRGWGPERIETGWWRGPRIRRDYYVVETEDGYRYWIFRTRDPDAWFLHGAF